MPHANEMRMSVASDELCPLCESPCKGLVCASCGCIVSLSQWERALANESANTTLVRDALRRIGNSKTPDPFLTECHQALGYLNLHDVENALDHLRTAARLQPDNRMVQVLASLLDDRRSTRQRTLRVLVVDDSATHTLFVTQVLRGEGFEVTTASDGAEGLARVSDSDLVLLDITMPGMDGYEVCKKVKEDARTASIPVVLLSGKDGFFDKVRGRMVGATDYLTKPCAPEQLVEMARRFAPRSEGVLADTSEKSS